LATAAVGSQYDRKKLRSSSQPGNALPEDQHRTDFYCRHDQPKKYAHRARSSRRALHDAMRLNRRPDAIVASVALPAVSASMSRMIGRISAARAATFADRVVLPHGDPRAQSASVGLATSPSFTPHRLAAASAPCDQRGAGLMLCGREDSNFHGVTPTSTSSLRVYHSATTARAGGGV
jgi:hypothetical protein